MPSPDSFEPTAERIETFLSEWMQSEDVPGVSVAVTTDDEILYRTGIGSRDRERAEPATARTLYGIGSCTKSFTATGILQLIEDGSLDVDDPITDHLPVDLWDDLDEPVTVHELLTHTSGFPGAGTALLLIANQLEIPMDHVPLGGDEDFYRHLSEFADAGERVEGESDPFFYNNSGWTLLGKVIEHRSGVSYARYVRDNVLDPLGMERSTFSESEYDRREDVLTPYVLREEGAERAGFPFDDLLLPAGGLLSSVDDLATYLQVYLNGGQLDGERVLEADSIDRMTQGYVDWTYELSSSDDRYGYGWTIGDVAGERVVGHIGDVLVSSAYLGFLPERDLGVAIAANTSPDYIMQPVGEAVLSLALEEDPRETVPFFSVREKLSVLEGQYESYRGLLTAEVTRDGATLRFRATEPPMMEFPLLPASPDRGDYRFYTISDEGERREIPVTVSDDGDVEIFVGRWRLRKAD